MSECERCGKCCLEIGATFWVYSGHPLVDAVTKRLGDDYYSDIGPCDMLVVHESGRATCLIQQWLGHKAKPKACRDYPFDNEKCFREKN